MAKSLTGIFAPITTPFLKDEVAFDQLEANMRRYKHSPLNGFFALGSNGESKSLTEDEKLKVVEIVLRERGSHQLVMVGTGCESTRQTIAFSKKVAEMGADFVSVVTPSYFKKRLTDEAMVGYYTDVADGLSIPVLAYNAPGFTGMTLSANVVAKISKHPNIAGMKDTSSGNMSSYLDVCGNEFDILSGTISTLFTAMLLGATGGVVSLADAFPDPCLELFSKCNTGDTRGACKLHNTLFRLNQSISGSYGVAGVKYAMDLAGYHGGDPRLPLLPLKAEDRRLIREAIEQAGLPVAVQ